MADPLKKLVEQMQQPKRQRRVTKTNRTLSLSEPQFRLFQEHCRSRGRTASEIVDELIKMYLAEAKVEEGEVPAPVRDQV